jgi:hypothetical protein
LRGFGIYRIAEKPWAPNDPSPVFRVTPASRLLLQSVNTLLIIGALVFYNMDTSRARRYEGEEVWGKQRKIASLDFWFKFLQCGGSNPGLQPC